MVSAIHVRSEGSSLGSPWRARQMWLGGFGLVFACSNGIGVAVDHPLEAEAGAGGTCSGSDCNGAGDGGNGAAGSASGAGGSGTSGEGGSAAGGSGAGGSGAGGSGGADGGSGGGTSLACRGADVLFVVDNSVGMNAHQATLASTVPAFIDATWAALPLETELHVGITTTSFFFGSSSSETVDCQIQNPDRIAEHYIRPETANTLENGGQGRLFEYQDKRYFAANTSSEDRAPLQAWLGAALTALGTQGSNYVMPTAAAGYAAHSANAEHNAGFLRDNDTVLAIVVLANEVDATPDESNVFSQMIRDAKAGCGPACVLTAGLLSPCSRDPKLPGPLYEFMRAFGGEPLEADAESDIGSPDPSAYAGVVGITLAQRIAARCVSFGAMEPAAVTAKPAAPPAPEAMRSPIHERRHRG